MNKKNMVNALSVSAMAVSFAGCNSVEGENEKTALNQRPNVLFIAIDDFTPKHWGVSGGNIIGTPNIDALAKDAVCFTRAYCAGPACGPSRMSLMSGLNPSTTGYFGNFTPKKIKSEWIKDASKTTMHSFFKANGYTTATAGKVQRVPEEHLDQHLDKTMLYPDRDEKIAGYNTTKKKLYALGDVVFKGKKLPIEMRYGTSGLKEEDEWDFINASRGIEFINQAHKNPFFLTVGFNATHLPFSAPKKYHDMFNPEKMKIPYHPENDLDDMVRDYKKMGPYPFRNIPENIEKEMMSSLFACMKFNDDQIGRIIKTLKDKGIYDNTIIVLWTDHGNMVGEHSIWTKGPLLEDSASSGLIIKATNIARAGGTCKRPVESVDIFATLADIAGLPAPKGRDSVSMRKLLENPDAKWKDGAVITSCDVHEDNSVSGSARMFRTEDYSLVKQYITTPNAKAGDLELYDLKKDPDCFTNVAHFTEYKNILNDLVEKLDARYKPYKKANR